MPLFYQPSRSSRHRKACLALYKALQRIGATFPLPPDLETGLGPENPIKTLIRNGFRRNRKDTSPRLVSAALKNGYRYIDLLSRAAIDTASPERASVLQFLKENRDRVLWLKLKTAAKKAAEPNSAPVPGAVPVLTKISDPDDWQNPVYIPTKPARPLSEIPEGIRKPPRLDAAGSVPFLRLGKPQGRHISRVLWQKNTKRQARTSAIADMQTDEMEEAKIEDSWERLVAQQLADEGLWKPSHKVQLDLGLQSYGELTFSATMYQGIMSLSGVLERERLDMIARAKAMLEIEQREQKLADQEDRERIEREGLDPRDVARFRMSRKRSKRGTKAGVFAQQPVQKEDVTTTAGGTRKSVGARHLTHQDMIIGDAEIELKTPEQRPPTGVSDKEPDSLVKPPGQKGAETPAEAVTGPVASVGETSNVGDRTGEAEKKSKRVEKPLLQQEVATKLTTSPESRPAVEATPPEPLQQQQQQQQPQSPEQQKEAKQADPAGEGQQQQQKTEQPVISYTKKTRKRFTDNFNPEAESLAKSPQENTQVTTPEPHQQLQAKEQKEEKPVVTSYTKKTRKRFTDIVDSETESPTKAQEKAQAIAPESPQQQQQPLDQDKEAKKFDDAGEGQQPLAQQKEAKTDDGEGQQQEDKPVIRSYTKKARKRFTDKFDSN